MGLAFFVYRVIGLRGLLHESGYVVITSLFVVRGASVYAGELVRRYTYQFSMQSYYANSRSFFGYEGGVLSGVSKVYPQVDRCFIVLVRALRSVRDLLYEVSVFPVYLSLRYNRIVRAQYGKFFLFTNCKDCFRELVSRGVKGLLYPFFVGDSRTLAL